MREINMKNKLTKITYKKIDEGYMCKPSYLASNGVLIEANGYGVDMYGNRYYITNPKTKELTGFTHLQDAKDYAEGKSCPIV